MRLRSMLHRAVFVTTALVLGALAAGAAAADAAHGLQLYATWCAGCHGADPRASQPHLAANNPPVLRDAIGLVSEMRFLDAVLAAADIDDIAAYIGSVGDTGVPALNPTPSALDFSAQTVGEPGIGKTLLLTNLGSAPLTIESVIASPADLSIAGNCVGNRNPNSTCALQVRFTASAAGSIAGKVTIAIAQSATPMTVPVLGAGVLPATTPLPIVVEYYEPELDHYFITADAGEQAFVDSGAVGRWLRTGNAFRSGGGAQVCRFYGNTATDPSGRPFGPNSHFYTADPSECEALKAMFDANAPSWKFESLDFFTSPVGAGSCASGTVPVYRAYNQGSSRGIESNHRITTNRTAIEQVFGRGWVDEGVVMCAPQALQ